MTDTVLQGYFDTLYGASSDPYGVRERWYEQRKREILLASLPRRRFRRGYEPGCGNGELSARLAERCDALLSADFNAHAVHAARLRLSDMAHVRVERHALPDDWPMDQRFDLVVVSELLYFLPLEAVRTVARHCAATLEDDGVLVACDWRLPFAQRCTDTDAVHATLDALGLPTLVSHVEADFRLQVWARDARSVGQQEGLR